MYTIYICVCYIHMTLTYNIYSIYICWTIRFLHPSCPRSFNAFKVKRTTSTSESAKSWCNWTYSSAARFEAAKPQKTRHRRQFWCLRKLFCFFLKGREKRNGKRPWFVPKQRVFESKASSKGSYSWWTNIRWNVTSWRISIPTCIWYVYTIIYLSPTFHKGHLPGPTLKKWNWLHQRQGWDDRWSSRSSSVHRMFFKDSKFHQHFSPDNFIRFLTFWGDKRMFN